MIRAEVDDGAGTVIAVTVETDEEITMKNAAGDTVVEFDDRKAAATRALDLLGHAIEGL